MKDNVENRYGGVIPNQHRPISANPRFIRIIHINLLVKEYKSKMMVEHICNGPTYLLFKKKKPSVMRCNAIWSGNPSTQIVSWYDNLYKSCISFLDHGQKEFARKLQSPVEVRYSNTWYSVINNLKI